MTGRKKVDESKKKTSKKVTEDQEDQDIVEDIIEESPKKKKSTKKGKTPKSQSKKGKKNESEDDELSDIDVNEEVDEPIPQESGENDEVINGKNNKFQIKQIDPEIPIGQLKTDDILNLFDCCRRCNSKSSTKTRCQRSFRSTYGKKKKKTNVWI